MDFQIVTDAQNPYGSLALTKSPDLRGKIFASLMCRKGSFFQDPTFGSELYKIKKLTQSNLNLAVQYCQKALQWMIDTGVAASFDILCEQDLQDVTRLDIKVSATTVSGSTITYTLWYPVGGPSMCA